MSAREKFWIPVLMFVVLLLMILLSGVPAFREAKKDLRPPSTEHDRRADICHRFASSDLWNELSTRFRSRCETYWE